MLCYTMPYHTILPLYNSCMHGMFKPLHAMLCFTLPYYTNKPYIGTNHTMLCYTMTAGE